MRISRYLFVTALMVGAIFLTGAECGLAAENDLDQSTKIAYAKLYFELAEARLRHARQLNEELAGSVSPLQMAQYEEGVKLARKQLDETREGGKGTAHA